MQRGTINLAETKLDVSGLIIINGYENTKNIAVMNIETEQVNYISCNTGNAGCYRLSASIRNNKLYLSGSKFAEYSINGGNTTFIKDYGDATPYPFTDYDNCIAFVNDRGYMMYIDNGIAKTTPLNINKTSLEKHIKFRASSIKSGYVLEGFTQNGTSVTLKIGEYSFSEIVGAQTLLASPVTKTPTNTMKIQYDFKVQKVL